MSEVKTGKRIVLVGQAPGSADAHTHAKLRKCPVNRVYLLSPAYGGGKRAQMLLSPNAKFELAVRLRSSGIFLGDAYSFMSPLYFRGKLMYASTFANAPTGLPSCLIITASRGLLRPEATVTVKDLAELSDERIMEDNPKYRDPLERDLRSLSDAIGQHCSVILLGSIATSKYICLLQAILGERLMVPGDFVGLGNLSRGALLLRCTREQRELRYVTTANALSKIT